ncbi:MAG: CcmD family protein [Saprospiraceae bacterium]
MNLINSKNNILKKAGFLIFGLMLVGNNVFGQSMNDFARSMGKMNVVITVIVTIFVGIIIFLIYMERRLSKLERQVDIE